jgi:hypothetical protein
MSSDDHNYPRQAVELTQMSADEPPPSLTIQTRLGPNIDTNQGSRGHLALELFDVIAHGLQ